MNQAKTLTEIIRIGFQLAKVNFRLRIEGSYLGIAWYLLKPLLLFVVLMMVKQAAFSDLEISFFPLYLLIGIAGFNFFREAITGAIEAINNNAEYIKSLNRLKPESLVIAVVIQAIFSHAFEFAMIIALSAYYGTPLLGLLVYPLVLIIFSLLTLGVSFICAAVGAYVNDLNNIWIIASQLLLLATPIFYRLPEHGLIYQANLINPLFYFLETARPLIITGKLPPWPLLVNFLAYTLIGLVIGWLVFKKYKKKFAEIL